MPPRWPRKPDRQDPEYRRLDDIMNFAIHVALFAAVNSGLWFVEMIKDTHWSWRLWFTGAWFGILILHLIYIKAIADYSSANSNG
jgi:integral membrane sensor domain MASE1